MATYFPENPVQNDTYQPAGSSTQYIWTGTYWAVQSNTRPLFDPALSGSITTIDTAGYVVASDGTIVDDVIFATASNAATSSLAITSSFSNTASSVNTLQQTVIISGSFAVHTGSATEFQVSNTGVTLGNNLSDRHMVTGSLNVTGSIIVSGSVTASLLGTASFATSASWAVTASALSGSRPTYIMATNGSQQSISNSSLITITNWTNYMINNAAEWNAATGIFTATKAGWYSVSAFLTFTAAQDNTGAEYGVAIALNGAVTSNGRFFTPSTQTATTFKQTTTAVSLLSLNVGDTIRIQAFQLTGNTRTLHSNGCVVTIQEVPSRIQR